MFGQHSGKALAAILTATMIGSSVLPSVALAVESEVQVADHAAADDAAQEISDLTIDGVEAPKAGEPLDDAATVRSAEGESWEVPVLWIDQDLQLATTAAEGGTYLPAIAFFVPEAYRVKATDGAYAIKLSDELTEIYGSNEVVSVFDAARGISYLLPARLRDYFTPRTGTGAGAGQASVADGAPAASAPTADPAPAAPADATPESPADPVPETPAEPAVDPTEPSNPGSETERTLVDIHCAKSVRDSFTDEDLEWFLDLVLNKLQPEAVNLLIEKFPAFGEAAAAGEIGTEIGLYVYNLFGEKDGIAEHENVPTGSLALVDGRAVPMDDGYHFGYMVGIDIATLAKKDEGGKVVTDPNTGKWVLMRDGKDIETFENTMVHEHFHALMFDYNRIGLTGSLKMSDYVTKPNGDFFSTEQEKNYFFTKLPAWFIEGSASAVENIYDFREPSFATLRKKNDELLDSYDMQTLVDNYIDAKDSDGTQLYYDLWYADGYDQDGNKIENENSAYVIGYLATLYLSELQVRQSGKTAIIGEEGYTVSSEILRGGLNDILKRLHAGETLDEVIRSISPVEDGKKLYNNTEEFQKKFIKGSFYTNGGKLEEGSYARLGDYADGKGSAPFVVDVLNYFERIGSEEGRTNKTTNGSILFDFKRDFASPLDRTTNDLSDYLKIIESNSIVVSTVPDAQALKDGGKSRSGTPGHDSAKPTKLDEYPSADIQTGPVPEQTDPNAATSDVKAASISVEPVQFVAVASTDAALSLAAKAGATKESVAATGKDAKDATSTSAAATSAAATSATATGKDATSAAATAKEAKGTSATSAATKGKDTKGTATTSATPTGKGAKGAMTTGKDASDKAGAGKAQASTPAATGASQDKTQDKTQGKVQDETQGNSTAADKAQDKSTAADKTDASAVAKDNATPSETELAGNKPAAEGDVVPSATDGDVVPTEAEMPGDMATPSDTTASTEEATSPEDEAATPGESEDGVGADGVSTDEPAQTTVDEPDVAADAEPASDVSPAPAVELPSAPVDDPAPASDSAPVADPVPSTDDVSVADPVVETNATPAPGTDA